MQDGHGRYWLGLFEDDAPDCLLSVKADVEKLAPGAAGMEGVLVEVTRA